MRGQNRAKRSFPGNSYVIRRVSNGVTGACQYRLSTRLAVIGLLQMSGKTNLASKDGAGGEGAEKRK